MDESMTLLEDDTEGVIANIIEEDRDGARAGEEEEEERKRNEEMEAERLLIIAKVLKRSEVTKVRSSTSFLNTVSARAQV
jgi:hypothetical protein